MKHKIKGRKFSRVRRQRKALLKSLAGHLIAREKIRTTEAKAKELKLIIDRIINQAKRIQNEKEKISAIRELRKRIPVPAAKKLSGDFIQKFSNRKSGYARVVKLNQRKGDGARMAVIEFVF